MKWAHVSIQDLPEPIQAAFPKGVFQAVRCETGWFAVQSLRDLKWFAFGPDGLLMTTPGASAPRRRWFRTARNCQATIELIAREDT
jgi:hypothetical protein